jgi:hypothetical protein
MVDMSRLLVMDLQGSGRSPRPKMDDPCNANPAQQTYLIPNPLSEPCDPAYPSQLNNSQSDWDELARVVEFIRNEVHGQVGHGGVEKVRLVGWVSGRVPDWTLHDAASR